MPKRDGKGRGAKSRPAGKRWGVFAGTAVLLAALGGGVWYLFSPAVVPEADPRFVLSATPRVPRPRTLDPAQFSGKVRRAYETARDYPQLLERMPCYCGCYQSSGHRNNLDCYTDQHAFG